jgi:hypothetical protein
MRTAVLTSRGLAGSVLHLGILNFGRAPAAAKKYLLSRDNGFRDEGFGDEREIVREPGVDPAFEAGGPW